MIRVYNVAAVMLVMLAACQSRENKEQLKAINLSLEKSNGVIKNAGEYALEQMENNHHDIPNSDRVVKLLLIMRKVKAETDTLASSVENLKTQLLKQSNNLIVDNAAILHSLYEPNGSGYSLLNNLASFKDSLPTIFSMVDSNNTPYLYETTKENIDKLRKASPLLPDYTAQMDAGQRTAYFNKWLQNNLRGSSALMAMVVLNKLENDILNTGAILMEYCCNQVGYVDGRGFYERYNAIAVLNSSYVKRGQTIKVIAGAAAFGRAANPEVSIEDREIKLDEEGVALYKFKATGKPGKHIIPVKISFKKINGHTSSVIRKLEYTIADEK